MFIQFKTAKMPKNQQSIFRAFSYPFQTLFIPFFRPFSRPFSRVFIRFFSLHFFQQVQSSFLYHFDTSPPHFFLMYTCWQRLQTLCLSIFNFCVVLCISEDLANSHETWDGVKFTDGWQSVLRDPKREWYLILSTDFVNFLFCPLFFLLFSNFSPKTFQVLFLFSRLFALQDLLLQDLLLQDLLSKLSLYSRYTS